MINENGAPYVYQGRLQAQGSNQKEHLINPLGVGGWDDCFFSNLFSQCVLWRVADVPHPISALTIYVAVLLLSNCRSVGTVD